MFRFDGAAAAGPIDGVVAGPDGPAAVVWVIAETTDLPTRFVRIVVTDGEGRYRIARDAGRWAWEAEVVIDPDGEGPAGSFALDDPDFNFRSLRGNLVFRWEYLPGSTLFLVWTDRSATADDDVFPLKASYWLGLQGRLLTLIVPRGRRRSAPGRGTDRLRAAPGGPTTGTDPGKLTSAIARHPAIRRPHGRGEQGDLSPGSFPSPASVPIFGGGRPTVSRSAARTGEPVTDTAATIVHVRRIEWGDTDASGVYHWATVFRLVEAAEAALHDRLGIRDYTFGTTPRVHVTCDFRRELAFYDAVRTELSVAEVGRSSVRYAFALYAEGEDEPAAEGELVAVHVTGQPAGTAEPWPPGVREQLASGGDQGRVDRS